MDVFVDSLRFASIDQEPLEICALLYKLQILH
jgi:hypothetical protein